jgi:hypothetical protein
MTSITPGSQTTLIYQDIPSGLFPQKPIGDGSILDYIFKNHMGFYKTIEKANMLDFFNNDNHCTLFVPYLFEEMSGDILTAKQNVRKRTTTYYLPVSAMLSSRAQIFPSLSENYPIVIKQDDSQLTINSKILLYGDIVCKNGIVHIIQ